MRDRFSGMLAVALAGCALAAMPAGAAAGTATLTTATGAGGDSYVAGGTAADSNFGADLTIKVKSATSTSFTRKGYLRFDRTSFAGPATSAVLAVTNAAAVTDNNGAKVLMLYGLKDDFLAVSPILDENWPEGSGTELAPTQGSGTGGDGSITWNSAPGHDPAGATVFASQTQLIATARIDASPAVGSKVYFSGSTLLDFINADTDGLLTFIIVVQQTVGQGGGYKLASREAVSAGGAPADWAPSLTVSDLPVVTTVITTAMGTGADAQVRGSSTISSTAPQCPAVTIPPLELHEAENAGNSNLMTVKATDTNQELGFARKAYVRFDLASRSGPADNATLTLRAGGEVANGPENLEPGHFSISLWGLPDSDNADNWVESAITWSTAPGNDPLSSTSMDPAHAVLLARTDVFRNPGTGLIIKFTNATPVTPNALLDFVNTRAVDSRITLVVTVDDTSTGDGFIFSTREFTPTGGTLGQCVARLDLNAGAATSPAVADAYIRGGAYAATNYGTTADMRINGKASSSFDFARKAYLSFDLAAAPGPLTDVTLNLTHKQAVSNDTGLIHTLLLYGVKESTPGQDWIEGTGQTGVSGPTPPSPITWLNAPANDVTTSDGKVADQATLLAMIAGPRTYVTGDVIAEFNNYNSVTPNALIDFINSDTDGRVTFVITASASHAPFVGQEIGWRFATKEHATVAPPTLTLNRISACGDPVFDVNNSHTVDAADLLDPFAGFYRCVTGPGPEAAVFEALSRECKCLDYNKDQAIDMRDFAGFQRCISVGLAQADPTCDD